MPDLCICLSLFRQGNLFIYLFIHLFGKALLWINNSYISQKQKFEVKKHNLNDGFISYKHNSLDSYSDWHPFTEEDPLVGKLCNAKFLQICSNVFCLFFLILIDILDGLRLNTFSANFHFLAELFQVKIVPSHVFMVFWFLNIPCLPFFHLIYDNKLSACLEK